MADFQVDCPHCGFSKSIDFADHKDTSPEDCKEWCFMPLTAHIRDKHQAELNDDKEDLFECINKIRADLDMAEYTPDEWRKGGQKRKRTSLAPSRLTTAPTTAPRVATTDAFNLHRVSNNDLIQEINDRIHNGWIFVRSADELTALEFDRVRSRR